jgi:hypothetical protein
MDIGVNHIAENNVFDLFRLDPGPPDRFAYYSSSQYSRGLVFQTTAKITNCSTYATQDNNVFLLHFLISPFVAYRL